MSSGIDTSLKARLPGFVAGGCMVAVTSFWTFWGTAELFHEGWWGPFLQRFKYLIPAAVMLALTLTSIRFPRIGGLLMIITGAAFGVWWGRLTWARSGDWGAVLVNLALSGSIAVLGGLFILEGRRRRRDEARPGRIAYVLAAGIPLVVAVVTALPIAPRVLSRVDDGDRGERLISYEDFALVWAPEGPGWARGYPHENGHPSWKTIALYGLPPRGFGDKPGWEDRNPGIDEMKRWGLPRYLSRDGKRLEDEPVDVWRLPEVSEIVRSLCRDGEPVRATWDAESKRATFSVDPEKETPLWAPDRSFIYMWALDERDEETAYWVSYNGWVQHQPKTWGNPRHGFRLVRDP